MENLVRMIDIKIRTAFMSKKGMELVQIAIIIGIALLIGLFFKDQIHKFVKEIFTDLKGSKFTTA